MEANPHLDNNEVAEKLGFGVRRIRDFRRRYGLPGGSKLTPQIRQPENVTWLIREANKHKITIDLLVDSIVTDARLEDQQTESME